MELGLSVKVIGPDDVMFIPSSLVLCGGRKLKLHPMLAYMRLICVNPVARMNDGVSVPDRMIAGMKLGHDAWMKPERPVIAEPGERLRTVQPAIAVGLLTTIGGITCDTSLRAVLEANAGTTRRLTRTIAIDSLVFNKCRPTMRRLVPSFRIRVLD